MVYGLYTALNDLLPSLMLEYHGVAGMQQKAKEIVLNSDQVLASNPFTNTLDYYKASQGASDMEGKQAAIIVCCKHFASGLEQVSPFPVSPGF